MNKEQFGQCAEWLFEGRLVTDGKLVNFMPHPSSSFGNHMRLPEPPAMPDEVWITPRHADESERHCDKYVPAYLSQVTTGVRYVRAGADITGDQMQRVERGEVIECFHNNVYRIKP